MEFLSYLKNKGIEVLLKDNGKLEVKTKNEHIEESLLQEIKARKEELMAHLQTAAKKAKPHSHSVQDVYALSAIQEGILFHSLFSQHSGMYIEQICCEITGALDIDIFKKSLDGLAPTHSILRTSFVHESISNPVQRVHGEVVIPVETYDYSYAKDNAAVRELLNEFLEKDRNKEFDLSKAPLMRVSVIKSAPESYYLVWTSHHILMDGWSMMLLLGKSFTYYRQLLQNIKHVMEEPDNYKDFINYLHRQDNSAAREFWLEYLSEFEEAPAFAFKKRISAHDADRPRQSAFRFSLDESATSQLVRETKQRGLTLNNTVQGIWSILLSRYTNIDNVSFGMTLASRPDVIANIENRIGLYINTLPLFVSVNPESSFWEVVSHLNDQQLRVFEHLYTPLADIQDWVQKKPLFNNILVFENYPFQNLDDNQLPFQVSNINVFEKTNYELAVIVKNSNTLDFEIQYDERSYDSRQIALIESHVKTLVTQIISTPERFVRQMEIISAEERNTLFNVFHKNQAFTTEEECLHQLFEKQVEIHPDRQALYFEGHCYTYKELNSQANVLAHQLREQGVKQDTLVGLSIERSAEMVIAIFAILKAGGAYVPVDVKLPAERIRYMLENSGTTLVLTGASTDLLSTICEESVKLMDLRKFDFKRGQYHKNLKNINKPTDAIYALYTSGSTGKPKGVVLEHVNITNLVRHCIDHTSIDFTRVLQYSTISFDVSVSEIFYTLCAGGEVFLISEDTRNDLDKLFKFIGEHKICTVFFPMSLLRIIFSDKHLMQLLPSCLTHIQTAGEQVVINSNFRKYLQDNGIFLHNHYGPSETHVSSTLEIDPASDIPELPSIGRPIQNCWNYIVDRHGILQPPGIPGELWIGGVPVGREYIGRDDLNKEKFIQNPFHPEYRVYKTGDLARWLPDGNIEFLGRMDRQVKIRGFRVEPGEIEQCLLNHRQVKQAVVGFSTGSDGSKEINVYVVGEGKVDTAVLQKYLQKKLPDYMIPAAFIQVEHIPLTPNGKINMAALPAPGVERSHNYVAPATPEEVVLIKVCAEILGMDRDIISMRDNFLAIGGHSIKAMQLISRIQKKLNIRLKLSDIFENPVLADLAAAITKAKANPVNAIKRTNHSPYYKTSSMQRRLFFLQNFNPSLTSYNMPVAYIVEGWVNLKKIEEAFRQLINRHEGLRTSFEVRDNEVIQKIAGSYDFKLSMESGTEAALEGYIKKFIQPFNLTEVPLFRVKLIDCQSDRHLLLMDFHHIISDAFSVDTLIRDFVSLYKGQPLTDLKLQYRDYAEWQYSETFLAIRNEQANYWKNRLSGEVPQLQLPLLGSGTGNGTYRYNIDAGKTLKMRQYAQHQEVTMNILMQAVFNVLLAKVCYQDIICLGTPMSGRRSEELENIVGMFVNSVVLLNRPETDKLFIDFLQEVKNTSIEAFENQEYPFDELVEQIRANGRGDSNPLFNIMFEFQNVEVRELSIPGLTLKQMPFKGIDSKFDLTFVVQETDDEVQLEYRYSGQYFTESSMAGFNENLLAIIDQILADSGNTIEELTIAGQEADNALMQLAKPISE